MEKVIQALQEKKFALLESPTGTGKTLCLLCSSLAWLMEEKKNLKLSCPDMHVRPPVIIYASRTHSQLTQVIKELKNTSYEPKTTILGSRNQMCVHPQVKKYENTGVQNVMCRKLVSNQNCSFHHAIKPFLSTPSSLATIPNVVDIEDLVHVRGGSVCPYYLAREIQPSADLIFMPYNYIIDPAIRQTLNIELNKSIIIFDEAHNLESVCCDVSSFEMTTKQLSEMLKEIQFFCDHYNFSNPFHSRLGEEEDQNKSGIISFLNYILN
jgi:regulator of telomere elongation helicase 1